MGMAGLVQTINLCSLEQTPNEQHPGAAVTIHSDCWEAVGWMQLRRRF